ncbi:GDSL-type esterase/lipase family protein [Weissella hellenica]|uniref:Hydrolase n=1 Tax=Weissella hellenica TaxID=46256 RepID=A0A4Y4FYW1_WEIHE|nr:GDSL-type esterase/lipase family protein [Weissella hellenica]NKY66687.1 hydrolase [Weissella hellenica]GED35119.1 lipase/acylhydrolase [Weissella hellenica]SCB92950.1 Lysophospholipase L1 [Weissella hellenica]
MFKKIICCLIAMCAVFLLNTGIIHAADKKTINFIAVGDSLTEGVGDTTTQQGYTKRTAQIIADKYDVKVKTANYGKAGDRSDQILKRIKANPKAIKQLKKADVIALTVGGNDLQQTLFKGIFSKSEQDVTKYVAQAMPNYTENLIALVNFIEKQNNNAPIYLFGNYNPLYVYLANRDDLNADVKIYNDINANLASADQRVYYVSTFKTLTYGQYTTKIAREKLRASAKLANRGSLNNSMVTKALQVKAQNERNHYITTQDHYHPNDTGYDKMSALLAQKMAATKQEWLKINDKK